MPDTVPPGHGRTSETTDQGISSSREPTDPAAVAAASPMSAPFADDRRLDGNAAGGVLGTIFPFEMTMAMATCAGCGTRHPLGAEMAYMPGMGTILRCPMCDTVLMRVAHIQGHFFLDLRGMQVLQIAEPDGRG